MNVQMEFGSSPFAVVVDDVNGDGRTDLLVRNEGNDSETVGHSNLVGK